MPAPGILRRPPHRRPGSDERGFALVATLSLMGLLAILAVGLMSLSTVAMRGSARDSAASQARANARTALMLAIGQLQRELGPDTRISAPHDAGTAAPGGAPKWTAVYDAWLLPHPAGSQPETPESRVVTFRDWLVSGDADASREILLLGPGTLGPDAPANHQVRVPARAVPDDHGGGKLAWWTSDEGTKARINAGPDQAIAPAAVSTPPFQTQAPPHPDHRVFANLADFEWEDGQRELALTNGQVNLAAGLGGTGIGSSFHDLTVHSTGVLADVRTGRLKRDLTQLLSRPVAEIQDMPLYLADGRMNRFEITPEGTVQNNPALALGSGRSAMLTSNQWGINLEELWLFHNIHRDIDWSQGVPTLVTGSSANQLALDRFHLYKRHSIEAMQFILSLQARRTGGTDQAPTYTMDMMLDAMVVLVNPNDVRLRFSPGLVKMVRLLNFPYDMKLKITKENGTLVEKQTYARNLNVFQGYIEGGFGAVPAAGFDLEPGEAAVFGSTTGVGRNLNIRRGFAPSGGVRMDVNGWNLGVTGLTRDDQVDFELIKTTVARNNSMSNVYYQAWHDFGKDGERIFDSSTLTRDFGEPDGELMNRLIPPLILPPQVRPVSDFIDKAQPVMLMSIVKNVERSSSEAHPDAIASRPFHLVDPALSLIDVWRNDIPGAFHWGHLLYTAEPLNYQFRTLAAGPGGRHVYHGGGRQPVLGGDFHVIKRRIPFAPPLSLGAFENAVAAGFCQHFGEVGGSWGAVGAGVDTSATALSSLSYGFPVIAKAIGNSFSHPFLDAGQVYRPGSGSSSFERVTTDPSWMVNTALWDSWFLSGIVDGRDADPASPVKDLRSPRAQFRDLAERTGAPRNPRYRFHPHKPTDAALDELFDGENFQPAALNRLGNYLLVDGAFNVNSTSPKAWEALLRSVAGQSLLAPGGATPAYNNPYGTIGYAADPSTTGTRGDWNGLRDLGDSEITALAEAIVAEVKARGPFLSLADFVNRRPNADDPSHRAVGALQAAIDKSGLNDRFITPERKLTAADLATLAGAGNVDSESAPARAVGSAGHLRQAGLLTALGTQINVRSDTFVIRAYGDHRDATGTVMATAYCEALVQRLPEFLDPADSPEVEPVSPINRQFGRAFRVLSFRWLNPSEI